MADKYVAKTGNNGNSGTEGSPWLTIQFGLNQISAGDTLYVKVGTYTENITSSTNAGTAWTAGNYLRVKNYASDVVTIQPTSGIGGIWFSGSERFIEFDGIDIDCSLITGGSVCFWCDPSAGGQPSQIRLRNCDLTKGPGTPGPSDSQGVLVGSSSNANVGACEFINCVVHGGGASDFSHGFYLAGRDNLVQGCEIYNIIGAGIQIYNGGGFTHTGNTLRGNIIHDPQDDGASPRHWGIVAYESNTQYIYNNIIYNYTDHGTDPVGIQVYGNSVEIYNNTVYGVQGVGIQIVGGSNSCKLKNNIAYNNSTTNIDDSGTSTDSATNLTTNPSFVDAANGNFRLSGTASAAYNAGTTVALVTDDFDGVSRPQALVYDIGAFELPAGGSGGTVALLTSFKKALGANGGTTDAFDSTGATLIIVSVNWYGLTGGTITTADISSSPSNTWQQGNVNQDSGDEANTRCFYCINPTTSASTTITVTKTDGFVSITGLVFSGIRAFDTQNAGGNTGAVSGTSLVVQSITPSGSGYVVVTGLATAVTQGTVSINNSYSLEQDIQHENGEFLGNDIAWKVVTPASAQAPTWSWVNSAPNAAWIASFVTDSSKPWRLMLLGVT